MGRARRSCGRHPGYINSAGPPDLFADSRGQSRFIPPASAVDSSGACEVNQLAGTAPSQYRRQMQFSSRRGGSGGGRRVGLKDHPDEQNARLRAPFDSADGDIRHPAADRLLHQPTWLRRFFDAGRVRRPEKPSGGSFVVVRKKKIGRFWSTHFARTAIRPSSIFVASMSA